MNARKKTKEFRKQYDLDTINSASLCDVIRNQGYTIVEFNGVDDTDDVRYLIDALQLKDQIAHSKCFIYQDDKYRIVFIHEDLNEEERLIVLAHEEGHIWNKHMTHNCVFGEDIIQEYEANEFAHFLLDDRVLMKRRTKTILLVCIILFFSLIGSGLYIKQRHDKAVYTDNLYRTETGMKYHVRDCIYIKDKKNVVRLKRSEFESGDYSPCEACMPDR